MSKFWKVLAFLKPPWSGSLRSAGSSWPNQLVFLWGIKEKEAPNPLSSETPTLSRFFGNILEDRSFSEFFYTVQSHPKFPERLIRSLAWLYDSCLSLLSWPITYIQALSIGLQIFLHLVSYFWAYVTSFPRRGTMELRYIPLTQRRRRIERFCFWFLIAWLELMPLFDEEEDEFEVWNLMIVVDCMIKQEGSRREEGKEL